MQRPTEQHADNPLVMKPMQLLLSPFLVTKTYFPITKKEVRQKTGIVITYVFRHHDLFGER